MIIIMETTIIEYDYENPHALYIKTDTWFWSISLSKFKPSDWSAALIALEANTECYLSDKNRSWTLRCKTNESASTPEQMQCLLERKVTLRMPKRTRTICAEIKLATLKNIIPKIINAHTRYNERYQRYVALNAKKYTFGEHVEILENIMWMIVFVMITGGLALVVYGAIYGSLGEAIKPAARRINKHTYGMIK